MSKVFNICTFLFAFFMPFHVSPRWDVWGMSVRIPIFFIIPIAFCLFWQLFKKQLEWKKLMNSKTICLLLTFAVGFFLVLVNGASLRSIGFCVWFAISIVYFLSVIHIDHRGALWGLLGGQFFNSVYILLQNYLYPWIWVPDSYFKAWRSGHYRNSGLSGEPSYVAILLIPALVYAHEKMEGWKRLVLSSVFVTSLFLCYSGIGLISLGAFAIFSLIKDRKQFVRLTLPLFLAGFFLAALQNPQYYGIPYKGLSVLSHWRSFNAKKVKGPISKSIHKGEASKIYEQGVWHPDARLNALFRGFQFFKERPWGVGPGNSKSEIIKRFHPEGVAPNRHIDGIHSIFLEIAIEFGIVGLITFGLFFFFLLKSFILAREWTPLMMCIGMLVPMQFAQNINMPGMWVTLAVAVGIFNKRNGTQASWWDTKEGKKWNP